MAGYVLTIAGGKGGVGKTTTAINLGAVLEEGGYDVVVVDADLGMANLGEMLGATHETTIHDVLAGNATVSAALTDTPGGLTIIPGEQSLEAFADADPAKLRKVIKTLQNTFDVVLVDTGAGLSHETTVPLGLADGILLVTTPDDVAVNDTTKTADLAERVDGRVIGVLVARVTRETDVPAIADSFEQPILGVIPVDHEATREEPHIVNAPGSNSASAYTKLTKQLERVFFEGAGGDELEHVFEESWFTDEPDESTEDADKSDDDEDSDGVFGGLFG
ncbi:septum site-determining protein MinD [Halovenus aranensis]|jgi:septum site-determining protein MinD|uniref:Septum site-determining protein MinD n=1 Tax=Halovenus aranensis TaxID=890420 RepID=A0A1G8TPF4_9EURY|nr:AAA family ATPase [Halovenus aranensis]SDJ42795.1 septum site-determining protein MinD [Halovenus aranensis]